MYIAVALAWLHFVDGVALTRWDVAGAAVALTGMAIIALQPGASGSTACPSTAAPIARCCACFCSAG
jgi:hypothetical protein